MWPVTPHMEVTSPSPGPHQAGCRLGVAWSQLEVAAGSVQAQPSAPHCVAAPTPSPASAPNRFEGQSFVNLLAPPSCPSGEKGAGVTGPELPWKEAFTLMCLELCLVRKVRAESTVFPQK